MWFSFISNCQAIFEKFCALTSNGWGIQSRDYFAVLCFIPMYNLVLCSRSAGPLCSSHPAGTQNNHTEIVLIKLLPGPLYLASSWPTLTSWSNPFLLICVHHEVMAYQERFSMSDLASPWQLSDYAFFLSEFSSVFSTNLSSALSSQAVSLFIKALFAPPYLILLICNLLFLIHFYQYKMYGLQLLMHHVQFGEKSKKLSL